jgi:hypothetical protein
MKACNLVAVLVRRCARHEQFFQREEIEMEQDALRVKAIDVALAAAMQSSAATKVDITADSIVTAAEVILKFLSKKPE